MIALKCAHCGQHVDIHESAREQDIICPHCGQRVSTAADNLATVPTKPVTTANPDADFSSGQQPTQKETGRDETQSANPSRPLEVFTFLSPAQGPGELGWLGHYRVIRLLGQGGMGVVFEAIDTKLQRPVALKVMKPDIARDESARKRFLREARATASVRSDHVVVIHQVDEYNRVPFLAMEFLQGEPLDKWLDVNGRPSLHDGLRIGIEIARGLAAAHEIGLIHRDIKPSNIWLEKRDAKPAAPPSPDQPARPGRVKILDFGLARIARDQAHLTHSGLVLGTPAYMAPEQAEGGDVDARGDLFSLGCVLYELATGSKPFSGTNTMAVLMSVAMKDPLPPQQINPDLPPSLAQLIMRLLSKRPADRPASASEVAAELEAIIDELGFSAKTPPSGLSRAPTVAGAAPSPTRGLTIGLSIGIFLVLLGLAVGAYWIFGRGEREIVLGMSGPLNGPSKELGREMELGIKIYLRHINDQGGIHGRKLRLIALDDGYEPDSALDNMKKLREDHKVFAVIGNIGTPTALKTVPYAVDNKMLFFGAFTGARVLRKVPPDRYVFNYRASYEEETAKIVEYLVEIRKDKVLPEHIAVFAQNDGYGDAGFNGVAKVMREKYKRDANKILRVGYERNTIQVHDAVKTILKRTDLRAVVMVGTYKPITEFIRQIKDAGRDMIFTNVSFVGSEALADGLKELGPKYAEGVIVTQVVPPIDSGASIVLKYHELRKKYYPNERATFSSLEGYISTALFIEGLKRAGDDPTPEKVIDALEQINGLDLGTGSTLSFSSSEHQASHTVWATVLDKTGTFRVLDLNE